MTPLRVTLQSRSFILPSSSLPVFGANLPLVIGLSALQTQRGVLSSADVSPLSARGHYWAALVSPHKEATLWVLTPRSPSVLTQRQKDKAGPGYRWKSRAYGQRLTAEGTADEADFAVGKGWCAGVINRWMK